MTSVFGRVRAALSIRRRGERKNIAALASHLGVSIDDAEWIYRRSREVGYPTAMTEFDAFRHKHEATSEVKSDLS